MPLVIFLSMPLFFVLFYFNTVKFRCLFCFFLKQKVFLYPCSIFTIVLIPHLVPKLKNPKKNNKTLKPIIDTTPHLISWTNQTVFPTVCSSLSSHGILIPQSTQTLNTPPTQSFDLHRQHLSTCGWLLISQRLETRPPFTHPTVWHTLAWSLPRGILGPSSPSNRWRRLDPWVTVEQFRFDGWQSSMVYEYTPLEARGLLGVLPSSLWTMNLSTFSYYSESGSLDRAGILSPIFRTGRYRWAGRGMCRPYNSTLAQRSVSSALSKVNQSPKLGQSKTFNPSSSEAPRVGSWPFLASNGHDFTSFDDLWKGTGDDDESVRSYARSTAMSPIKHRA